jgi:hypothetical protein
MHGVRATFFCTHAGVDVGPHERGLHPNYRRNGTTLRELRARIGPAAMAEIDEEDLYRHVLRTTLDFAPEAKGARSHSLFYDSLMIPLYRQFGLEYDSSYQLPLTPGLQPIWNTTSWSCRFISPIISSSKPGHRVRRYFVASRHSSLSSRRCPHVESDRTC